LSLLFSLLRPGEVTLPWQLSPALSSSNLRDAGASIGTMAKAYRLLHAVLNTAVLPRPHRAAGVVGTGVVRELADDNIDVAVTCRVLNVSRSGYYGLFTVEGEPEPACGSRGG
jgi:hypothetical protein